MLGSALLWPNLAAAHGLRLSVSAQGQAIAGEASFADGSPLVEAAVELRGAATVADEPVDNTLRDRRLARSRTDARGRFAFPSPGAGEYRIVVDDGLGHRSELRLTLQEDPSGVAATSATGAIEAEHRHWPWRQWLSGLGYLLGLFGLAAWWLARRRNPATRN